MVIAFVQLFILINTACLPSADNNSEQSTPVPASSVQPPSSVEMPDTDKDIKLYSNTKYSLSIEYPKNWVEEKPSVASTIFLVQSPDKLNTDNLQMGIYPIGPVRSSILEWSKEQLSVLNIYDELSIKSEKPVKLADNKTDCYSIELMLDKGSAQFAAVYYGFIKDEKVIMISAASTDPSDAKWIKLRSIVQTLSVDSALRKKLSPEENIVPTEWIHYPNKYVDWKINESMASYDRESPRTLQYGTIANKHDKWLMVDVTINDVDIVDSISPGQQYFYSKSVEDWYKSKLKWHWRSQ